MSMPKRATREPGVYPCSYLIDGRPAYFVITWDGTQSEDHVVSEDETEEQVIRYLADALWAVRPRGLGGGRGRGRDERPGLRLVP
jgi:hypothetical protein